MSSEEAPGSAVVARQVSDVVDTPGQEYYSRVFGRRHRLPKVYRRLVRRRVWTDFFADGLMDRGATLSFFTLMSVAPGLLALYSIATLVLAFNAEQVHQLVDDFISRYLPQEWMPVADRLTQQVIGTTHNSVIMLLVSVVLALFSASSYVRAFSRCANSVYGRLEGRGIVRAWLTLWLLTIALITGMAVIFVGLMLSRETVEPLVGPVAEALGLSGSVSFLLDTFLPMWSWLRWPVLLALSIVLVAVLYHFAPNVRAPKFRWMTHGSAFTLLGGGVAWWLVRIYVATLALRSPYGALGTAIAALFAVWIVNTLLVLGVKIDAEMIRARELSFGLESERVIQIPPRATKAAVAKLKNAEGIVSECAEARRQVQRQLG